MHGGISHVSCLLTTVEQRMKDVDVDNPETGDMVVTKQATAHRRHAGFTEGSVGRHLLKLGSFMAMGTLTMNVAQLAEAVYLGMVSTEALAAMGFAFPITITLFAFAGGIGSGASSVISRALGAGDRDRVSLAGPLKKSRMTSTDPLARQLSAWNRWHHSVAPT